MACVSKAAVAVLAVVAAALLPAGCGGPSRTAHTQAEVRAMFAAVAADGQAHDFGRICQYEMDAQLRQLAYLVGANCMKTMAAEWVEGVQLSRIGSKTRIVISGNTATVFDGVAPDRAVYANGRWELAETPRNRRFDRSGEAREATTTINRLLREHHQPELGSEADAGSPLSH
jgi:hypothetical protein